MYDSDDILDDPPDPPPNDIRQIHQELELLAAQEQLLLALARVAALQNNSTIDSRARPSVELKRNIRALVSSITVFVNGSKISRIFYSN